MITVVANLKGGSGKSTVTFNLAVWLARAGKNTISFDLDPQATLSDVAEVRDEEGYAPVITVHRAEREPATLIQKHKGEVLVDVGAANLWAMREAINMANRIVVPVTPSQADVWSTQRFLAIVRDALKHNRAPKILVFLNRADTHRAVRESNETEQALSSLRGLKVLPTRLCQRTAFRRSFSEGLAVFELERNGKAAREFEQLANILYPSAKPATTKKKARKKRARGRR